jgi:hypothetical protein
MHVERCIKFLDVNRSNTQQTASAAWNASSKFVARTWPSHDVERHPVTEDSRRLRL